ncbi:MAG: AraC family transcriptional regulator [Clostridiales bacterium]|nr:AraC family transcriptional regulator [Clostridiales bacterium]
MYTPFRVTNAIHISNMYSLFTIHYPNGYTFDGEVHDFWECLFIRTGSLHVVGDDRVYDLAENDFIVHSPLELHKFVVTSSEGVDILVFSFDASGIILNKLMKNAFHLNAAAACNAAKIIDCINAYKNMFTNKLHISLRAAEYMTRDNIYSQTILSYIYLLLAFVKEDQIILPSSKSSSAVIFGEAVRCMENNIHTNLTIPRLSRILGASPTNIQNAFIKHSGLSVHKYFVKLKINTAISYLSKGMDVTTLAELLGFSSQAHFTNTFKKETGLSPTAYRKLLEKNHHSQLD